MYKTLMLLIPLLLLTAGCINVSYDGQIYAPTTEVKVFEDKAKVPKDNYAIVGHCRGTGDYNKFSKADIYNKIIEKAKADGADAILIYAYQIVPGEVEADTSLDHLRVWGEDGSTVSGWNRLEKDFSSVYGTIGENNTNDASPRTYTRILRAWFLKDKQKMDKEKPLNETTKTPAAPITTVAPSVTAKPTPAAPSTPATK